MRHLPNKCRTSMFLLRDRPFNSWGVGWVISGHQQFFFLAIWWAGYFFPFYPHKLSISFMLHAIFLFRQALAGIFFFKINHPRPHPIFFFRQALAGTFFFKINHPYPHPPQESSPPVEGLVLLHFYSRDICVKASLALPKSCLLVCVFLTVPFDQ